MPCTNSSYILISVSSGPACVNHKFLAVRNVSCFLCGTILAHAQLTSSMVTFFHCVSQLDCPLSMFSLFNVFTHTTPDPTFANIAELAEHQGLQEKQRKSKQGHAKQLFLWQQPAKQIRAMPCTDFLYILIEL